MLIPLQRLRSGNRIGTESAAEVVQEVERLLESAGGAPGGISLELPLREVQCGEHGIWYYWGPELGYAPRWQSRVALRELYMERPWDLVHTPPLEGQSMKQ